jgi:hypothetical protein
MTTFKQGDQNIHGDQNNAGRDVKVQKGDTITMGDVSHSIVNLKSTLTNVTQSIGQIPQADEATKQQLATLLKDLLAELAKAPADKADDAELVADNAEELMEVVAQPEANPKKVEQKLSNLKKAAEDIKEVMPTVLIIATQIIKTVLGLPQFLT